MTIVSLNHVIDLETYPIEDPDADSYRALVRRCRDQFDDAVSCHLPGFLISSAVEPILGEIDTRQGSANLYSVHRGAYNREDPRSAAHLVSLSEDDPRGRPQRRHQLWLGTDDLSSENSLCTMYDWPALTRFVRDVLGVAELYTLDDPLMRILINIHRDGDELGWHVDSHDYAVTLLLRPALEGGLYQYVPMSGPGDDNFAYCAKLFDGDVSRVRTVPMEVGSMVIFRGRNTLHRVTPVRGTQHRALALFSYDVVPGRIYGSSFRMNLLGRAEPRTLSGTAKP
jgi:hypothetical protein